MTTIDQIRKRILGTRSLERILPPDELTLSEEGTSTRIGRATGIRFGLTAVPTMLFVCLIGEIGARLPEAYPQLDNALYSVPLTIVLMVLGGVWVARFGWSTVTSIFHGPRGPGQVWVIEELHAPVESAIAHLRQMPSTATRDRLITRLEKTLRIAREAAVESVDDPVVFIHVVRWAGEHIEWIDERAQYLTTHPNSGFTAT